MLSTGLVSSFVFATEMKLEKDLEIRLVESPDYSHTSQLNDIQFGHVLGRHLDRPKNVLLLMRAHTYLTNLIWRPPSNHHPLDAQARDCLEYKALLAE